MKTSQLRARISTLARSSEQDDFRMEVQNFLSAMSSYPDRVAKDRDLSFEEHLFSVIASAQRNGGRRNYARRQS
ncbi:MAG TPA: hypothetical protein VK129_12515 [Terriglobales bacterium]|nr:hypothetical protein [Terriglobales bacterium]